MSEAPRGASDFNFGCFCHFFYFVTKTDTGGNNARLISKFILCLCDLPFRPAVDPAGRAFKTTATATAIAIATATAIPARPRQILLYPVHRRSWLRRAAPTARRCRVFPPLNFPMKRFRIRKFRCRRRRWPWRCLWDGSTCCGTRTRCPTRRCVTCLG